VIEFGGDLVQHGRGVALPSVRPSFEKRLQLILERPDEPARELISLRREGDHGRTPIAFVRASLDPASLNRTVDEVGHVRPVAAQGVCETADGGRLHRRAEKLRLGSSQAMRAARPQIRVIEGHPQATESARDRVGRLLHAPHDSR
jgi:hypothetical protein